MKQPHVIVTGGFDDLRSRHLRFLEEAAKLGELTVALWPDELLQKLTGRPPKFPLAERRYFLEAVRYVGRVFVTEAAASPDALPGDLAADVWAEIAGPDNAAHAAFCREHGLRHRVFAAAELAGFPETPPAPPTPGRPKVIVTGCYDWFHSGHVRFFEEVSRYGDLYVVVGHDANIRLLKGEGHPLVPAVERRYVVGSIRYVKQALISSGDGWMDAAPEIARLRPDIYAVNEDGDRPEKRAFCEEHGLQYLVLQRTPAPGLPRRTSTNLRGF
jgi:cytidyltransferase-like protein